MSIARREFLRRASGTALLPLGTLGVVGCAGRAVTTPTEAALGPKASMSPPGPTLAPTPMAPASPMPGPALLPTPDFSSSRVLRCIAGVRPYRASGIRIEPERFGSKTIIHNYGHGGAGITLAWGSAERAVAIIDSLEPRPRHVGVLGAGVIGLTTAHELLDRGCAVSIYAQSFPPHTTSNIAGGQWSPSGVSTRGAGFGELCRRSFERYEELIGEEFAVFRRTNYVAGGGGSGFRRLPRGVLPPPRELDRLPFDGPSRSGQAYDTLLIEPDRFLGRLMGELRERCEAVERRSFEAPDELEGLPQPVIVNCTGLGARDLAGDSHVRPIKGHLVLLEAQDLPYLLSHRGYIFPRTDALVLGGTYEQGRDDLEIDDRACERILRMNRGFFGV